MFTRGHVYSSTRKTHVSVVLWLVSGDANESKHTNKQLLLSGYDSHSYGIDGSCVNDLLTLTS